VEECVVDVGTETELFVDEEVVARIALVCACHCYGVGEVFWRETSFLERFVASLGREIDADIAEVLV
jgi:hypothetical protein